MSVNAEKLLRTAFGEIEKVVTANIAIGAPLHFEGTTIIPVVGMSVDFGGVGGSGLEKGMGESESSKEAASGAGGGAGCGFTIKPVALIIIDRKSGSNSLTSNILSSNDYQLNPPISRLLRYPPKNHSRNPRW